MPAPPPLDAPSPKDVLAAAERVRPFVHHTPLLTSRAIDGACGRSVLMKAEHLQKVGAYKARGATNQVRTLLENGPAPPGVVAMGGGTRRDPGDDRRARLDRPTEARSHRALRCPHRGPGRFARRAESRGGRDSRCGGAR
ncbi:MAG: pyridoxal-phosphate dependent enzyme [Deltaproteobacteria bacterium]|nr:MAG: pyridoxal-phosphate dependent enzyme [Deltaproteobacteria bacterium]